MRELEFTCYSPRCQFLKFVSNKLLCLSVCLSEARWGGKPPMVAVCLSVCLSVCPSVPDIWLHALKRGVSVYFGAKRVRNESALTTGISSSCRVHHWFLSLLGPLIGVNTLFFSFISCLAVYGMSSEFKSLHSESKSVYPCSAYDDACSLLELWSRPLTSTSCIYFNWSASQSQTSAVGSPVCLPNSCL